MGWLRKSFLRDLESIQLKQFEENDQTSNTSKELQSFHI